MAQVDFIVPCYNERESIGALYEAFVSAFDKSGYDWRLILVDDGSSDGSFDLIAELAHAHKNIHAIQFSRNFGKEAAIMAGLAASTGEYAGIIDADLQQPPAIARQMLDKLVANDDLDCVAAYQENRKEGALVRALKSSFYKVFAKAARSDIIADASDFRVFRRRVAQALLSMPEYHRFSKGMFAWVGFNTYAFPYTPDERTAGTSKWSIASLFKYAFEGLLSFTTRPLHFITVIGFLVFAIALIYFVVLFVRTIVNGVDVPGYASTFGLVLLMGGGQFLAIGIIGEYLARAYIQGKNRPIYVVRQELNAPNDQGEDLQNS